MSRQHLEGVVNSFVEEMRNVETIEAGASLLKQSRHWGVHDYWLYEKGISIKGYDFDEDRSRFYRSGTGSTNLEEASLEEAANELSEQITKKKSQPKTNDRLNKLMWASGNTIRSDHLASKLNEKNSATSKLQVVMGAISCTGALLDSHKFKGSWQIFDDEVPSARKPINLLDKNHSTEDLTSTTQWHTELQEIADQHWPILRRAEQLILADRQRLPVKYRNGDKNLFAGYFDRRFCLERSSWFVIASELADISQDEYVELVKQAIEGDGGAQEMVAPIQSSLFVYQALRKTVDRNVRSE